MSKKTILWISISALVVIAIAALVVILKSEPQEVVKSTEEILSDEEVSKYISISGVVLPNELSGVDNLDVRKVEFKPELGTINLDEGAKVFLQKEDYVIQEVIDKLVEVQEENAENKIMVSTIINCENDEDMLYVSVKYKLEYSNNKVKEYLVNANILLGNEENGFDAKTLTNEELFEHLKLGNAYEMSNQIFDILKKANDYTIEKDKEFGIFCSDLHFDLLREKYLQRVWEKVNDLVITKQNGKLVYNYLSNDGYDILRIEGKKSTKYETYNTLVLKEASKYKVPEEKVINYDNDKFTIDDAYLKKIYQMNDQFVVAQKYDVTDFVEVDDVDLEKFGLKDECICINEDFIDGIKFRRVLFKGLPSAAFKDFVTEQEKTFRKIYIALEDYKDVFKHGLDTVIRSDEEYGPYDTKIMTGIVEDILSVHTINVIPYAIGDTEEVNTLLIDVRSGKKITNTEMLERLSYTKGDVVKQIGDMISKYKPEYDKELVKANVDKHLNDMRFYVSNEKAYLVYNLENVFNWMDESANKGAPYAYETLEIIK